MSAKRITPPLVTPPRKASRRATSRSALAWVLTLLAPAGCCATEFEPKSVRSAPESLDRGATPIGEMTRLPLSLVDVLWEVRDWGRARRADHAQPTACSADLATAASFHIGLALARHALRFVEKLQALIPNRTSRANATTSISLTLAPSFSFDHRSIQSPANHEHTGRILAELEHLRLLNARAVALQQSQMAMLVVVLKRDHCGCPSAPRGNGCQGTGSSCVQEELDRIELKKRQREDALDTTLHQHKVRFWNTKGWFTNGVVWIAVALAAGVIVPGLLFNVMPLKPRYHLGTGEMGVPLDRLAGLLLIVLLVCVVIIAGAIAFTGTETPQ